MGSFQDNHRSSVYRLAETRGNQIEYFKAQIVFLFLKAGCHFKTNVVWPTGVYDGLHNLQILADL